MVDAGQVRVRINGDMSGLDSSLRRATAATDRAGDQMSRSFQRVGAAVRNLSAIIGAAVAAGVGFAIREAANAEEISSKFDAVFRDSADSVRAWARVTADQVARSSIALEQYLSSFQDTFVPLGFAREEAARFSQQLTQLTIDLASFNNAAEPETAQLLASALVGNHEAVRRFGIVLTQATLEQELLNMGIRESWNEATTQQQVLARLNVIMRGTADAQGDAAQTAESATNQWREFSAKVRDAAVAIGDSFMPAALRFMEWGKTVLLIIERLGIAFGNLASAIGQSAEEEFADFSTEDLERRRDQLRRTLEAGRASGLSPGELATVRNQLRRFEGLIESRRMPERIAAQWDEVQAAGGPLADALGVVNGALSEYLALGEQVNNAPAPALGGTASPDRPDFDDLQRRGAAALALSQTELGRGALQFEQAWAQAVINVSAGMDSLADKMAQSGEVMKDKMSEAAEASKQAFLRFTVSSDEAALAVTNAIGSAFDRMARGIRVTFRDLANEILAIMSRVAFNNLIARPLNSFFEGLFSGGFGGFGGIGGGASGVNKAVSLIGAFAPGGVPAMAGAPATAGGGSTVINIDARYATEGTAQMIEKRLQSAVPGIVRTSVDASVSAVAQRAGGRRVGG